MNVALPKDIENIIERFIAQGRYNNPSEVVGAGLRALEAQEQTKPSLVLPPGSLAHLYTDEENAFERKTVKASSKRADPE